MDSADLVLALIDRTQLVDPCRKEWECLGNKVLKVLTKGDLPQVSKEDGLLVSSQTGTGLDELRRTITHRLTENVTAPGSDEIAINARHEDALRRASEAFATALSSLNAKAAPELVAADLRQALQALESILGVGTSEDVLDRLFAQFCIGK
jgi:tRNA modification GTPase